MYSCKTVLVLFLISCSFLLSLLIVPAVRSTEDYWTVLEPLPVESSGFRAAVVNERIYVMKLNTTYEYNLDSWSTKTCMPTSRDFFGIASCHNNIYCIGGRDTDSNPSGINEVYDPLFDSLVYFVACVFDYNCNNYGAYC